MSDRAAIAVAVARELGFEARQQRVLSRGVVTTVFDLGGLVARVSSPGFGVRSAVTIASHAAGRGGPVVPPARTVDPGPHERQGMVISFWERVADQAPVDPGVAGRTLRELHETLEDCAVPLAPFAHPAEALHRLARLSETRDHELLRAALSLPPAGGQALHGDAAVNNCVGNGSWIDFDFAARGPREADVATLLMRGLVHGRRGEAPNALAGYGPCDRELVQLYLRGFVALTCVLLLEQISESATPLLIERLAWLRATR